MRDRIRSFRLSPPYECLLWGSVDAPVGLYQLHLATAEQLTRLHYSATSLKWVKKLLKRLTDHGYLQADAMPTKRGNGAYYYALGEKGMRYLAAAGLDISAAWRPSKEMDKSALFLEHTLELGDVLISAALVHRQVPHIRLERFVHERALKRKPYKTTWHGQQVQLIPDALLVFRAADQRLPTLLEHDRGTEEQRYFRRRVRAHVALHKEDHTPVVFTTFMGDTRREQMRAWTKAELDSTGDAACGSAFRFASLSPPLDPAATWCGPLWYTPYSDLASRLLLAAT